MARVIGGDSLFLGREITRPSKYPWKVWLDGKKRVLTKGKDFKTDVSVFRVNLCMQSKKHGKRAALVRGDNENEFILQAVPRVAE
jgi:hypothetical protein